MANVYLYKLSENVVDDNEILCMYNADVQAFSDAFKDALENGKYVTKIMLSLHLRDHLREKNLHGYYNNYNVIVNYQRWYGFGNSFPN